jgi:hypothetical protein
MEEAAEGSLALQGRSEQREALGLLPALHTRFYRIVELPTKQKLSPFLGRSVALLPQRGDFPCTFE